jgi:transposase
VQELRVQYREKVRNIPGEDLVFVDEAGSHLGMTLPYARSPKGTRAYSTAPCSRGQNVSMIAAIALKGLLALVQIVGSTKGIQFEAFIASVLVPLLWDGAYVIMDNAKIHQEEYIRPLIENAGAHLIFLPPYSPDFSPLENCWSKIKQILKTLEPRNYSELRQAVCVALSAITLKDIHGWFTHGCYCNSPFVDTSQSPLLTSFM